MKRWKNFKFYTFILLLIGFLYLPVVSQVNPVATEQGSAGGKAQSGSYIITSIAGQPGPVGFSAGLSYFVSSGLIPAIDDSLVIGDITAPAAPENLSASPGNWNRINNFSVTWSNPEPDGNISGAYYKIGQPPVSNTDGIFKENAVSTITGIQVSAAGIHSVYIWLVDVSGNSSYINAAATVLRYDNQAPAITHTAVSSASSGADIIINASSADAHSGISQFVLFYRKTGESSSEGSVVFTNNSSVIPSSLNTQQGVEYVIGATDSADNRTRFPETGYFCVQTQLSGTGGVEITSGGFPVPRHSGATVSDYRIFSVPLVLNDKKPVTLFETNLGPFDDSKWKLFAIENGTLRDYNSIKNMAIIEPGEGFLLIVNMADKYIYSGNAHSPDVGTYSHISISAGWNLIGNPFDVDIPLDSISLNGSIPEAWSLGGSGWANNPTHLKKWQGLAVYSDIAAVLTIHVGKGSGSIFNLSSMFGGGNWGMGIHAAGENNTDLENYIGVSESNAFDSRRIWHEPPVIGPSVSLSIIPGPEGSDKYRKPETGNLSAYIQEKGINGNYWDIKLTGHNAGEYIQLTFDKYGDTPDCYLLDRDLKLFHNLTDLNRILEVRMNSSLERHFRIISGSPAYIDANGDGVPLLPVRFELRQNFPNPFNPVTSLPFSIPRDNPVFLEIFNVLGQKVRTLINGKTIQAGYYTIEWDGRNDRNQPAGSGVYLFRLSAGTESIIRKGILVK